MPVTQRVLYLLLKIVCLVRQMFVHGPDQHQPEAAGHQTFAHGTHASDCALLPAVHPAGICILFAITRHMAGSLLREGEHK